MTRIEWADKSWNPMTGCTPVSEGCEHCYALRMLGRSLPNHSGPEPVFHPDRLDIPLHWHKPRRIFVCSMSDLFHEAFTDEQIAAVFGVMALGEPSAILKDGRWWPTTEPHHTYMVLTKRPDRMQALLNDPEFPGLIGSVGGVIPIWPMPHLWLGVTVENGFHRDRLIHLRNTPAAVRFVSIEPMLGALPELVLDGIDWVILGGETGPGARPMRPEWALDVYRQTKVAGVPFFFKKWGSFWLSGDRKGWTIPDAADGRYDDMFATHEYPEVTP